MDVLTKILHFHQSNFGQNKVYFRMPKGQYPLSAEIIYFGQFQLSAKMALFQISPFGIDRTSFGQALLCSRPSRRRFCRGTRRPSKFFEPVSITVSEAATAIRKGAQELICNPFLRSDQTDRRERRGGSRDLVNELRRPSSHRPLSSFQLIDRVKSQSQNMMLLVGTGQHPSLPHPI